VRSVQEVEVYIKQELNKEDSCENCGTGIDDNHHTLCCPCFIKWELDKNA